MMMCTPFFKEPSIGNRNSVTTLPKSQNLKAVDCDPILKGWVKFEYEGQGEKMLKPGDCVLQPAGIKHREIEHSFDLELIEIVSPANFGSKDF